ncbi:non-ribosomal peptide synthetase [Paenibacillus sp. y28]|uniref:non-ribosomal peptide synthetase n=1 Tax=Paenibacillus sp. y28 TaxID=3129110 RepID=UPI00301B18BF
MELARDDRAGRNRRVITLLHAAWGIVFMKYHQPDNLLLCFDSNSTLPVWTCKYETLPSEAAMCLEMTACPEDTLAQWCAKLAGKMEPYWNEAIWLQAGNDPLEDADSPELQALLEQMMKADRKLNQHLHAAVPPMQLEAHLKRVYRALRQQAELRICDVELLHEQERSRLLHDFNRTEAAYSRRQTIHGRFMEQAAQTPDNRAVVCNNVSLSYKELDRKSGQLAAALRCRGVRPGQFVAITADRTPEMVIGLLAILKAGAAYLPVDPRAPEEHTRAILEDSGVRVAVTQAFSSRMGVECINPYDPLMYEDVTLDDTPWPGSPADLAYVIYTSGTTGTPKGVLVRHQGVVNFAAWFEDRYRISRHPHVLQTANLTFDASVESIFCTLLNGGTVFLIRTEMLLHKGAFRKFIDTHQVHVVPLVPSLLSLVSEDAKLESVHIIISGGEVLEQQVKDRIIEKGYRLYNHYGPTETTVVALASDVREQAKVTLGRPIANTRIYIVNPQLELCPIGILGEICIAGDGLAAGYLNRETLTSERFVPNPYEPDQLMYRTGDIGRWLADGTVEYAGRADDQLKINGVLIHPETIRKQLLTHPAIHEAFVMGVEVNGMMRLHAYYTTKRPAATAELREFLLQKISPTVMPGRFVEVPYFPVNLSGKINKKALLAMS